MAKGELELPSGKAAKTTRGSIKPTAVVTDNKDKILKERYHGCLRPPSRWGLKVTLDEPKIPPPGIGREVSSRNNRD